MIVENKEVLVFRTNISSRTEAEMLGPVLNKEHILKWNVDLEDQDRVLRIETTKFSPGEIIGLVREKGVVCEEME